MTGLERLRVLAGEMTESKPCDELHRINGDDGSNCFGRSCSSCRREALEKVANQIEREHLREVDDISGRDADAIAWVESHGGIKECDRKVEASMEVGDKYTLLRMELGKMLGYDLMGQLDATDEELVEKVGKRLMPEGMEWLVEAWPRFEDDAPVKFGDMALIDGDADMVEAVQIWIHGKPVIYGDNGSQQLEKGERVKRPAVLAADGEPLEVGQTVWHVDNGMEFTVNRLPKPGEYQAVEVRYRNGSSTSFDPDQLTRQRPVLDADGVLCREGDEVWEVRSHRRRKIVGTNYCDHRTGEPLILCDGDDAIPIPATCVTHTKPEPPDSWERVEEDKDLNPFEYCKEVGHKLDTCENAERFKANDIVRRCKRLAGVS